MMKCRVEPTGGWSGVEQFEVRSVQQRDGREMSVEPTLSQQVWTICRGQAV